jgi:2-iminobutanoate/2-iminopropanoate deaminase
VGNNLDGSFDPDIAVQAEKLFQHLTKILAAADMSLEHVVQMTTYVTDMSEYQKFAAKRKEFLGDIRPGLTLVQVTQLASPAPKVEVAAVAAKSG